MGRWRSNSPMDSRHGGHCARAPRLALSLLPVTHRLAQVTVQIKRVCWGKAAIVVRSQCASACTQQHSAHAHAHPVVLAECGTPIACARGSELRAEQQQGQLLLI